MRTSSARIEQDEAGVAFAPAGDDLELFGFGAWPEAQQPAGAERAESLVGSLAVPPTVDPRMRALAQRLAAGATTPAARIQATVNYLQRRSLPLAGCGRGIRL
jgi:transglutaminase-like putative cysteine protease